VARLDHRLPERLSGHRAGLPTLATTGISAAAPAFYPNLPAASAVTQLKNDLPTMAQAYYGGTSMSAQTIFQQRSLVNAFMEARANFGSGGGDTFAALHADVQAQNSYISAARQAMTWVPVLNLVLTIVFYAMFPVVFPLFLFPQTGPALLKGYLTGFFYLASWGPIYAVLHMFITQYSAAQLSALAPTGMTMATMAGIDSVNQNMETLAGYLLMFVPVMAAGMAKGAMSIASNTTAMLAPAMHAAEAAAVERTTGNYAYGNSQFQNVTGHQVNTAPTWNVAASPIPQVNMRGDNGTITSTMADGSTVYNTSGAISRFGFSASEMQSVTGNLQQTGAQSHARQCRARNLGRALEPWDAHPRQPLFRLAPCEGAKGRQAARAATPPPVRSSGHRFQAADRLEPHDRREPDFWPLAGPCRTNTFGINAGIKAGVGGKVLGADVGLRQVARGITSGPRPPAIRKPMAPASLSQSQGSNVARYHANGQDITLTDGGYWRDGTFHRVENFSEKRHAIERDFSEAQSLERQATRSDEVGSRLERMASLSRSNGYQISDDMSQVIASRYAEMAASPEFRDLGAPSLTNTTPSPHQREVRNMIVGRILEQYAAEGLAPVRAGWWIRLRRWGCARAG
jgi:conjugal transfer mating pair stabilization protein TraG